MIRYGIILEIS